MTQPATQRFIISGLSFFARKEEPRPEYKEPVKPQTKPKDEEFTYPCPT